MDYMVQFTGPTGANAVEAAMKLARTIKKRQTIINFTNGYHGVTMGALAATGNQHHRGAAGTLLTGIDTLPYDGYMGDDIDTSAYLDKVLTDSSSGIDHPAAIIVETVQGEGGITAASFNWLRSIQKVCDKHDLLLIIDDIQAGCGRTGTFFSFEEIGINPDIITLSKSLSGYGLPFAVALIKPEHDIWKPGEHNGTFRGNNLAFVTAKETIDHYWSDELFTNEVRKKGKYISERVQKIIKTYGEGNFSSRGRGMFQGLNCVNGDLANKITKLSFKKGLMIETSGADDHVIKFLCPLTISDQNLKKGIDILEDAIKAVCASTNNFDEEVDYFHNDYEVES